VSGSNAPAKGSYVIDTANEEYCAFTCVREKAPKPFPLSNRVPVASVFAFGGAMRFVQSVEFGLIGLAKDVFHSAQSADSLHYKISLVVGQVRVA
jgi:hypothetical protein